jgi:ATP-dependent RNA helicase DeaD
MLFSELNLRSASMKAVEALGFTEPSEIQEKSIPKLMAEEEIDFIGQAQTGTGKTAAFTLPLLEKIDYKAKHIQAMVIAPTRELANQICTEIDKLSKFDPVRTLAVYGGVSIGNQLSDLRRNKPQIIVGTPGRLLDVMKRGAFDLLKCKYVILDEADEMLDMGFFDDVQEILAEVPEKKIWMFSATMPKQILSMINKHFCNPELVKTTKKILTADNVTQQFCIVQRRNQAEALCRYLDFNQNMYAIVFCRTRVGCKELTDELNARGFASDALHGDMSQDQRDLTMKKFKEKKISLLICTDVAARGIDVTDLTHVVNFSLPQDNESYVHRIGRTGRGGNKGIALSIIESNEVRRISQIERITKAKIEKIDLPTVADIVSILTEKAFSQFEGMIEGFNEEADENYAAFKTRFAEKSQEDIMKGLYAYIFEQSLKRYKKAYSIDVAARVPGERSERGERGTNGAQSGYQRYHITLGRKVGLGAGDLIKLVSQNLSISGGDIGKISVMDDFSFFELPDAHKDVSLNLNEASFNGESFKVQVAKGRSDSGPRRGGGNRGGGGGFSRSRNGGEGRSSSRSYSGRSEGGENRTRTYSTRSEGGENRTRTYNRSEGSRSSEGNGNRSYTSRAASERTGNSPRREASSTRSESSGNRSFGNRQEADGNKKSFRR